MATDPTASIADRVRKINAEISGVKSLYGVTSWEETFLASIAKRDALTTLQETTLQRIEVKVFGKAADTSTQDLFA